MEWKPIETAPTDGKQVILANIKAGWVSTGYSRWQDSIPRPLWDSLDPDGIGRCNPTHWMPLPELPK